MSINQICDPNDLVARDEHKHQCKRCGTTWKHSDDVADMSSADFDEAHSCPKCGREETYKLMDDQEREKRARASCELFDMIFGPALCRIERNRNR